MDAMRAALDDAVKAFSDSRISYCRLELVAVTGGTCALGGAVLDQKTLEHASREMAARFPDTNLEVSRVRILRSNSEAAAVGTNLAGLYARPSFLAEQLSQLVNGWPVEVLLEDGPWRFVRQTNGYLGWIYGPYLAPSQDCVLTHLVSKCDAGVRAEPRQGAALTTRLLGGTAVAVDGSEGAWRHVALAGEHSGWVAANALRAFSVLPEHEAARREQIMADAIRFVGAPYLWGGCTAWGIDCSGFSQLLHRLAGVTLPRDADMQFAAGRPVDEPYQPGDLLFFGDQDNARKITHVAVSCGGWDIIHSSRRINGVYPDNVQAVEVLRDTFVGARSFLKD